MALQCLSTGVPFEKCSLSGTIAAGSGSFTTSTTGESNRTKAAALIEIGQNLKVGFDRIVGNGTDFADVVIDPTETDDDDELFSPTGGGITSPSRTMADDPAADDWHYPLMAIPGIGTAVASGGGATADAVASMKFQIQQPTDRKIKGLLFVTHVCRLDYPTVQVSTTVKAMQRVKP